MDDLRKKIEREMQKCEKGILNCEDDIEYTLSRKRDYEDQLEMFRKILEALPE